jgi:hypothetical protein
MKPPRLRFTVRGMMIAVALVSIVLAGIALKIRTRYCYFRVVNRSGQPISQLAVTVWGERVVIEDLADGSAATVPFWKREELRISVAGALADKTPVMAGFHLYGDPKRFRPIVGTVGTGGRIRLSLSR